MNDPERCAACPSGLGYATEDQLLGVIVRHHEQYRELAARAERQAVALREADTALLRALSDLRGYEDGGWTATQNVVLHAASTVHAALKEAEE